MQQCIGINMDFIYFSVYSWQSM